MPTARPSPIIMAEMAEWTALGGSNLGILGDANHTTGFHRAGFQVPPTDYSRRHDPGLPYDMEWACAGDFGHGGRADLRARHAAVLGRLMRGELPMIDEYIGQPWPDQPVKYWARWNGTATLKNFTGSGHTTWSHISWRRSRANERAHLWAPGPAGEGDDMTSEEHRWLEICVQWVAAQIVDSDKVTGVHLNGVQQTTFDNHARNRLVERAVAAVSDAQAADLAERVAAILTPRMEATAAAVSDARVEAAVERVVGRARLSVDAPAGG